MSGAFGERLRAVIARALRTACASASIRTSICSTQWGLDASAAGAREFGLRVVEAAAGRVGIVKPQVSFFERYGSAGFAALEDVLAAARAAGLLVIADAKRGDIGSTMDAYARAWLTPGSPLEADALTVSPYLGVGSLGDTVDARPGRTARALRARRHQQPGGVRRQRADRLEWRAQTVAAAHRRRRHRAQRPHHRGGRVGEPRARRRRDGRPGGRSGSRAVRAARADPRARASGTRAPRLADLAALFGSLAPASSPARVAASSPAAPAEVADRIQARLDQLEEAAHG